MAANIGTSGFATNHGIPQTLINWTGRSGTTRSATIFTTIDKTAGGEISQTRDNSNEIQAVRLTNDQINLRFSAKPIGTASTDAFAICADLPKKNSILVIYKTGTTAHDDADLAATGTVIVDDASLSYTPDGETVINFSATKHIGKTFAALT